MRNVRHSVLLTLAAAALGAGAPALAQAPAKPLQVQETNIEGVNAELTDVTQREGVLTIKMRFRNVGANAQRLRLVTHPNDVDKYFVVAGSTKLLPLRDSEKVPLMSALDSSGDINPEVKPGGSFLFWAKFPAPPAGTKKIAIYSRQAQPFEDVSVAAAP